MSGSHAAEYERLVGEYQEQYRRLVDTQRRLREIACTVTAPRRVVSVTVGHGGVVTELTFPTGAYKRMAPAELATVVLDAVTAAQQQAVAEAAAIVAPSVPAGVNAHALLSGSIDLQSMVRRTPEVSDATRELLSRMTRE